jgi:predicted phage terminase large subunit-like protein
MKGAIDGGNIWWVMPTKPLSNEVWRDLKKACRGVMIEKNETERRIEMPGGGSVTIKSADEPDSLRGSGLDGVVLDEAATIKEEAWTAGIRPALIDKQGWATFIGTPKGMNWYHKLFERAGGDSGWERWQRPTSDNPLISPEEIDEARRDLASSLLAAQELGAQFVANGGTVFQRDWFTVVDVMPADCKRAVRRWDKAATEGDGDFSAGVLMAEHDGIYYVVDVERGQWSALKRNKIIRQTADFDLHSRFNQGFNKGVNYMVWLAQDPGSAGKEVAQHTATVVLAGYPCDWEPETGDKATRAKPFASQCEAGNVRLVRGPWNADFVDELCAFPDGAHDDQVDAASGAFIKLARAPKRGFGVKVYENGVRVDDKPTAPVRDPNERYS